MASKKVFKVSFKGVILPGFDQNQVIENVHEITRIPKQTIIRKFFSGKTVVIRHADSQDYASRLQKTFAQAGIETYINEFFETIPDDEQIDTESVTQEPIITSTHNLNSVKASTDIKKSHQSKIIAAVAIIVTISLSTLFFMNSDNQPQSETVHQATDSSSEVIKNITEVYPSGSDNSDNKHVNPSSAEKSAENKEALLAIVDDFHFIKKNEISGLIKITEQSELKQFMLFSSLLNIKSNLIDIINNNLNSSLIISEHNPLYLFKTMDKAEPKFSLLISTKMNSAAAQMIKLDKELNHSRLDNNEFSSSCTTNGQIKVLNVNHYLWVTTIDDNQLADLELSLKHKNFSSNLRKLDSLFIQANDKVKTNFNFYYRNKETANSLRVSSNNESFWFSLDNSSLKKMQPLLQQLNIDTQESNKRSDIKTSDLYTQTLLMMTQQNDAFKSKRSLTASSTKILFQPEQVVKIVKFYSTKNIQDYKNSLDVELLAQWQSGPFAITTNQFKFNKNLSIELLAKGQNIKNLMEYAHSAFLQIESVFNKKNVNILIPDCTQDKAYFQDIDGEQEAYINDDFISYQTITAKHAVNIEPGYNNFDINKIEGKIVLKLPLKIQQQVIELTNTNLYSQIQDFSLLTKYLPKSNTLDFKIIGKTDQFISIRAYNYSGDVIDTISLDQKTSFDNKMKTFRQTFSEPIEAIKAFYTKENKVIKYPFAFKPEMIPSQVLADLLDENIITYTDSELIPYIPGKLNFIPLTKKVQEDNPEWLGTQWSSEKLTQKVTSPFYINLFMLESDGTRVDSVLNIKSSLSAFISQNMTAVKLTLLDDSKTLIDNFISFNMNEFIEGEPEVDNDGQIIPPQMTLYLNSSTAFEINKQLSSKNKNTQLHGHLTLSLPTTFKTHSKRYTALGQIIKLDGLFIKTNQLNKHKIQFEVRGNIKNLVQLKLYNKGNKLISEPFEFNHLEKNSAQVTLLYHDEISTVKLVLSQNSIIKQYPFSFSK